MNDSLITLLQSIYQNIKAIIKQVMTQNVFYGYGLKHVLELFFTFQRSLYYLLKAAWNEREALTSLTKIYIFDLTKALRSQTLCATILDLDASKNLKHKIWNEYFLFRSLKIIYLETYQFVIKLTDLASIDIRDKDMGQYTLKLYLSLFSPANLYFLNPEILETTWHEKGRNLLKGINHFLEDCLAWYGYIHFYKNNTKSLLLGKDLATTQGKVIYESNVMQLLCYPSLHASSNTIPVLIVPSWINKYYIFDLRKRNSIIQWLNKNGYTVFIISWINPNQNTPNYQINNYMQEGIFSAIKAIKQHGDFLSLHTLGYCLGGTILSCALSILNSKSNLAIEIKTLTLIATLLDFEEAGTLSYFFTSNQLPFYNKLIQSHSYWDGRRFATAFNLLNPNDYIWPYWINRYGKGKPTPSLDSLIWSGDLTNATNAMYEFYMTDLYHDNRLAKNNLHIGEHSIQLSSIDIPTYIVAFKEDHISPWTACVRSAQLLSSVKRLVIAGGGHFTGLTNLPNQSRYNFWLMDIHRPKQLDHLHKGSWWQDWNEWILSNHTCSGERLDLNLIQKYPNTPGRYCLEVIG